MNDEEKMPNVETHAATASSGWVCYEKSATAILIDWEQQKTPEAFWFSWDCNDRLAR